MPDIQLIKLTIRRGTDAQRKSVTLEQGELGFTTDYKRLWIGDGVLSGGHIIGAKVHPPLASGKTGLVAATTGDVVYENSLLYQLTGTDYSTATDWGHIGAKPDKSYIQFDGNNKLTLVANSIDGDKFAPAAAFNAGGLVATTSYGLSVVPDYSTIEVASSAIRVKDDGIDENKINSSSFGLGLDGGSGATIHVDADYSYFGFIGTTLTLSALPDNSVTFESIDPAWVGSGLTYDAINSTINANLSGINSTLTNNNGVIGLASIGTGETVPWAQVTKDVYGRVSNLTSTLVTALTCNTVVPVVSAFNGFPNQTQEGVPAGVVITTFTCTSGTNTVTLSSAGFVSIEGATTQDGSPVGRVAIPVFAF